MVPVSTEVKPKTCRSIYLDLCLKMTKEFDSKTLQLANTRLMDRISVLQSTIDGLNRKIVNLEAELIREREENDNLKNKVNHKETIIRKYQAVIADKPEYPKELKNPKSRIDDRNKKDQKRVYGILKNYKRYKVDAREYEFLTSIQGLNSLSDKQRGWLNSIFDRGRSNRKNLSK